MCPPGTYVRSHCSKSKRTECVPCGESLYTGVWNYVEECLLCDYPCSEVQEEVHSCNATHNRVCRCKEGYYSAFGICLRHTVCPPGEGVSVNGTSERDVECAECLLGSFSNESSSTASCQPNSKCGAHQTSIPGSATQDTFCSSCRVHSNSLTLEGLLHGQWPNLEGCNSTHNLVCFCRERSCSTMAIYPRRTVLVNDIQLCNQEVVRLVLERLNSKHQKKRLLGALRYVDQSGSPNLNLQQLLNILVAEKEVLGLDILLDVLDRAGLTHLHSTIKKWFTVHYS